MNAWAKGVGFALAAIIALILIITGGVWIANVISPKLLGWSTAAGLAA